MGKPRNDPKRLLLLDALRFGRYTVGELCEVIDVPRVTSWHRRG